MFLESMVHRGFVKSHFSPKVIFDRTCNFNFDSSQVDFLKCFNKLELVHIAIQFLGSSVIYVFFNNCSLFPAEREHHCLNLAL